MELNNTINIFPNIYLTNNLNNVNVNFMKINSISNIIIINNHDEKINVINEINELDEINNNCQQKNIILNETNMNFDYTNKILLDILQMTNNILIVSNSNILGFTIVCGFLIANLDVSFFQILVLDKFYNIQFTKTKYYELLYNYYNKKHILN